MIGGTDSNSGGTSDKTVKLVKIGIAALLGICSVILGVEVTDLLGGLI